MNNINWSRIAQVISIYQSMGYQYLEVPWIISDEATNITLPAGRQIVRSNDGALVGSAEQSFIQLMLDGKLEPGQYVAATPCFRDDQVDELHQQYFFKVELIDYATSEFVNIQQNLNKMMTDAHILMRSIGAKEASLVRTADGFDIELNGIELGSYGYRKFKDNFWIYGTGLAEPRFTQALELK